MKNNWESVGFSFRAALWFRRPVILFTRSFLRSIFIIRPSCYFSVKCNDSVSFSFLSPCFFSFVKDQIASFQLKQITVFLNYKVFRVSVYFIAWLQPRLIIKFSTTGSELYCMQLIVWTLNMNYNRKKWSSSVSCRHFQTKFFDLPLENRVLLFAWIKAKVKE